MKLKVLFATTTVIVMTQALAAQSKSEPTQEKPIFEIDLFKDSPRLKAAFDAAVRAFNADPAPPATVQPAIAEEPIRVGTPSPDEQYVSDGTAEAQHRAELKRQAQIALNARNDVFRKEITAIRAEDASALNFLSQWCANNDRPSGDCMIQVTRARKIEQRMQALLTKDGAVEYLAKTLILPWRPESPIRAAAVKMPLETNLGNAAARDYVAKTLFRDDRGGFLGCRSTRDAAFAAHGDDMHQADESERSAKFWWDRSGLIREIAAIQTSESADAPFNQHRICVMRARWAELLLQAQTPVPPGLDLVGANQKSIEDKASALFDQLPTRTAGGATNLLRDSLDSKGRQERSQSATAEAQTRSALLDQSQRDNLDGGGVAAFLAGAAQGYLQYEAVRRSLPPTPSYTPTFTARPSVAANTAPTDPSRQITYADENATSGTRKTYIENESHCISILNQKPDSVVPSMIWFSFRNSCGYSVSVWHSQLRSGSFSQLTRLAPGEIDRTWEDFAHHGRDRVVYFACRETAESGESVHIEEKQGLYSCQYMKRY